MQQQNPGSMDVNADDVFIGNGVSEMIMLAMRALLNPGDEVLVPSPDYPLWTASVVIHGAKAVHYPCRPENGFIPDPAEVESLVTDRTRALVVINPNNPTGAVYPRDVLAKLAAIAERRHLVFCADEIYDEMLYGDAEFVPAATLVSNALCLTFGGLSKIYRACRLRVGWLVFSGEREHARTGRAARGGDAAGHVRTPFLRSGSLNDYLIVPAVLATSSPPLFRVRSEVNTAMSVLSPKKRTAPSPKRTFKPPGWNEYGWLEPSVP
jgi:bifunctional pyridoxal-dependent enzyme with beta-cystathionase and maltose regulon repressor activities